MAVATIAFVGLAGSTMASPAGSEGEINWQEARQFWAFQKPVRHDLPGTTKREWARERLDHFILARMEAASLSPAPAADRRT